NAEELGAALPHVGGDVLDLAAQEGPGGDEELEVDHVQARTAEERAAVDLALDLRAPLGQKPGADLLAGATLLFGVLDAVDRTHLGAHLLDGAHDREMPRRLELVLGMEAVLAADQGEDRVRLRERPLPLDGEDRQGPERRAGPPLLPLRAAQPLVLEPAAPEPPRNAPPP